MVNVEIYFNPYTEKTRLFLGGQEQLNGESRLYEFMVGQTIDKWLSPYTFSYQKWNGILLELVEYLNDDELKLHFFGATEYLSRFADEVERQSPLLEKEGYSPELCRLHCAECFAAKNIREPLIRFVRNKKSRAHDQYNINLFEYVEEELGNPNFNSTKQMRADFKRLQKAIQSEKDFCQRQEPHKVRIWENAESELMKIFNWQG